MMEPATMAEPRRADAGPMEPTLSPRDRIRRGRTLKHKDVTLPDLGRFRLTELSQSELENMVHSSTSPVALPDGKKEYSRIEVAKLLEQAKAQPSADNRGWKARVIAFALINDDGTKVYPDVAEGIREIGALGRIEVDALFEAVDELNLLTKGAKDELGKASGATGDSKA